MTRSPSSWECATGDLHWRGIGDAPRDGRRGVFRHDRGDAFGIFFTPMFYVLLRALAGNRR